MGRGLIAVVPRLHVAVPCLVISLLEQVQRIGFALFAGVHVQIEQSARIHLRAGRAARGTLPCHDARDFLPLAHHVFIAFPPLCACLIFRKLLILPGDVRLRFRLPRLRLPLLYGGIRPQSR